MSTTQLAATLFQLQQLDLELERLVSEQQNILTTLQDTTRLQRPCAELASTQQRLRAASKQQQEAEWALEDLNRRVSTLEQRLYSGNVTNPKELGNLQKELQLLRTQQSQQEEKLLEIIETVEALQAQEKQKVEALQHAESTVQNENRALGLRRDQLETKKQELQTRRTKVAEGVDTTTLARYDMLRRSKQGKAISKVEQSSCQWCRVILTPSELQRVRTNPGLQTCSNCGRILYYDR